VADAGLAQALNRIKDKKIGINWVSFIADTFPGGFWSCDGVVHTSC